MTTLSKPATDAIRLLVSDIVRGNYAAIATDGRIGRLTTDELQSAVAEYGRTLVDLPLNFGEVVDVYPTSTPGEYAVDVPLWTAEEGRSDLTLSGTIREQNGLVSLEIDDLHVL